jgi:hypothetical protein
VNRILELFKLRLCPSVDTALVAIKTHKPTLFLDIDMPEKMGLN